MQRAMTLLLGYCNALPGYCNAAWHRRQKMADLRELLKSFGCADEVALIDDDALGAELAEVVIRALSPHLLKTKIPVGAPRATIADSYRAPKLNEKRRRPELFVPIVVKRVA
jgi:hypothetical protein